MHSRFTSTSNALTVTAAVPSSSNPLISFARHRALLVRHAMRVTQYAEVQAQQPGISQEAQDTGRR